MPEIQAKHPWLNLSLLQEIFMNTYTHVLPLVPAFDLNAVRVRVAILEGVHEDFFTEEEIISMLNDDCMDMVDDSVSVEDIGERDFILDELELEY